MSSADKESGLSRRDFLQIVGATLAAAGLTACHPPPARILPYTRRPSGLVPGNPLHFATATSLDGRGSAVLVTSWEGRPTKVEGNPDHPLNRGAAGVFDQASLLGLYDPDRARVIKQRGAPRARETLLHAIQKLAADHKADGGARLRFLLEPSSSPLMTELRARILREFSNTKFYSHASVSEDSCYEGARLAFGRPLETRYDLESAKIIVALDSDLLGCGPDHIGYSRAFAEHRDPDKGMNRLYVAESRMTVTGTSADHRLRVRSADIASLVLAIGARLSQFPQLPQLLDRLAPLRAAGGPGTSAATWVDDRWVKAVAGDLAKNATKSVLVVGPRQPAAVHALVHAINEALGNNGATIHFTAPLLDDVACGPASLGTLAGEMRSGKVDTLVITAWNPVYAATADLDFAGALARVPNSIYLGTHEDETYPKVTWFVPAAHALESWGDTRSADGTVTLIQPLIAPLFGGVSAPELISAFLPPNTIAPEYWVMPSAAAATGSPAGAGGAQATGESTELRTETEAPQVKTPSPAPAKINPGAYPLLQAIWKNRSTAIDFQSFWEASLQKGLVEGTAAKSEVASVNSAVTADLARAVAALPGAANLQLELYPDYKVHDGRFANNPWLQELPDPITSLTWDNAVHLSPVTAKRLGVDTADLVEIESGGVRLIAPVLVQPGHADECASLSLGYGRGGAGAHADGAGVNAGLLRKSATPWFAGNVSIKRADKKEGGVRTLALTQKHFELEGRTIALQTTLESIEREPNLLEEEKGPLPSLYPEKNYEGYKWGLAIDLSKCNGCNACVVACGSENNIPWVGKEQVAKGRHMQWIRVDRYHTGKDDDPGLIPQPMMCVHCENAPCEYVCPVNATVHSDEGLNEMVYNRCVGTRYCSNNCPYKVRRFNYMDWHPDKVMLPVIRMVENPDVTVRARGVMEKCTYCVQRIERTRITARIEGREIGGDEIQTACQQTCPSKAIVFGNLNDKNSAVSKLHADRRSYEVLHELGTRPRTAHLVRIKNPNPELA